MPLFLAIASCQVTERTSEPAPQEATVAETPPDPEREMQETESPTDRTGPAIEPERASDPAVLERCRAEHGTADRDPGTVRVELVAGKVRLCNAYPELREAGSCDPARWLSSQAARCVAEAAGVELVADVMIGLEVDQKSGQVLWTFSPADMRDCSKGCTVLKVGAADGGLGFWQVDDVYYPDR